MKKSEQEYIKYSMILPHKLSVEIYRVEEGGFWAKIKEMPGCNTQGDNFFDLLEMINDAIFTYFDVPKKIRKSLGQYIPEFSENAQKLAMHQKMEEIVNDIVNQKKALPLRRYGVSKIG